MKLNTRLFQNGKKQFLLLLLLLLPFIAEAQVATVGNYVWTDTNSNGIQDETPPSGVGGLGLNGVTVQLWSPGPNGYIEDNYDDVLLQTTTTANGAGGNPGYYQFIVPIAGDYYLKFPTTNGANALTSLSWGYNNTDDSDAFGYTGNSSVFALDPASADTLLSHNLTYDAGYTKCLQLTELVVNPCANVGGKAMSRIDVRVIAPSLGTYPGGTTLIMKTNNQTYAMGIYSNNLVKSFLSKDS